MLYCVHVDYKAAAVDGAIGLHPSVTDMSSLFAKLLDKYPSNTKPETFNKAPTHNVEHFIETSGSPIRSVCWQLFPKRLAIGNKEFADLEELGVIWRSNSP